MSRPIETGHSPVLDKRDILSIAVDYMQNDIALESYNQEEAEYERYVPRNCEDVVQGLFGNLKRFRIYGSVAQFVEELMVFQNFPGSHRNFSISATSKYYTVPVIYLSHGRREKFICKQDLFSILHHFMLKTIPYSKIALIHSLPTAKKQIALIRSLTTVFLKREEDKLGGRIQFAKYCDEELKSIETELTETQLTFVDENRTLKSTFFKDEILEKLRSDFAKCAPVEILAKFTKLVPTIWGVKESERIRKGLESVECFNDREEWLRFVVCSYTNTICILKKFEAIMKKRPELFKSSPYFESQNNDTPSESDATTPSDSRPFVRLFEDGPLRYVMRDELLLAIGYTCSCKKDSLKMDFCCEVEKKTVPGIPFDEVLRKYRSKIEDVDFIRCPILRTRHRAVPISASFAHQFYVPAVDGLLEVLKSMIWGSRIFQNFPIKRKKDMYELFAAIGTLMHYQNDFPFFIQRQELVQITLLCAQKCSFHIKTPLTELRDVGGEGFTLQDLKEELKHLELTGFLPDIMTHTKRVFQDVERKKREEILKTCDMFDAVESCQLISIFNLFPKLKSFLHAQKSCRRIPGLRCDTCKEFTAGEWCAKEGPATEKFEELGEFCIDANDMVQDLIAHGRFDSDGEEEDSESQSVDDEEEETDSEYACENPDCTECRGLDLPSRNCTTQTDFYCGDREFDKMRNEVESARIRIENFEKTLDKITQENLNVMDRVKKDLKRKHDEVEVMKRKVKLTDAMQKKCVVQEKKMVAMEALVKKKDSEMEECKSKLTNVTNMAHTISTKVEQLASALKTSESELKTSQKQNEQLKAKYTKISSLNSTILEENEELKIRLAETESRELQFKGINEKMKAKFDEDRAKFSERIAEMGRDLRSEKSRISSLEAELREAENVRINTAENVQHREEDMANQMQRHVQMIHDSNVNLRTESEVQKRTIQELMRRLEMSEQRTMQIEAAKYQSYQPPSPSFHHHHHQHANLQYHQNHYEAPRHEEDPIPSPSKPAKPLAPIGSERAANRAPSVVRNEPSSSSSSAFPLLQNHRETRGPPPPSVILEPSSSMFHRLHRAPTPPPGIRNQNPDVEIVAPILNINLENLENPIVNLNPPNPELSDRECVICLTEMRFTDNTIKCHDCRRRFHSQCASDWLKVKSICPTCMGKLLDPDEFPVL